MKKLVLSQTCQGTVLEALLMSSEAFSREFTCTFIPNFEIKDGKAAIAPPAALEAALLDCNILIYHDIACYNFPSLLRRLPEGSQAVKIPYITSTSCWPTYDYWNPCWLGPRESSALIPWPCKVLSRLITTLKHRNKCIDTYLAMDLTKEVDATAHHAGQIAYLKKAEAGSIFGIADFVSSNFASMQLFHLINHPTLPIFLEVANTVLRYLQLPPLEGYPADPFWNHQMPVHPSIIRHFGLSWCSEETKYIVLDKTLTFEEYVAFYVDAYIEKYQYAPYPTVSTSQKYFAGPLKALKGLILRSVKFLS